MKLLKFDPNKSKAQAMVEFAIVLPILLVLLYGLLETGRFLFIYSSVVTASRQAARYGSATGLGVSNAVPRYQDCEGMRAAASAAAYINTLDDSEIVIEYDGGPSTTVTTYCTGTTDTSLTSDILGDNEHRIVVTVTDQFVPLVPLVPFTLRPISATSSRTVLLSVSIIVPTPTPVPDPTTIEITSDLPDPSEMNQAVTVSVLVTNTNDPTKKPTGTVLIADSTDPSINCSITLSNGVGSCTIIYTAINTYTITAQYAGNSEFLASNTTTTHAVALADTITTITSDSPDPSVPNQSVPVFVTVIGGLNKPTGTVDVNGGAAGDCTITLVDGAGSCTLTFTSSITYLLTANYNGDSEHKTSSDTDTHQVMVDTPTATNLPTATPLATNTPVPTLTPAPPTGLPNCNGVTTGYLTRSGNTLTMQINNPLVSLEVENVTIQWNDDKGHADGDKNLILQSVNFLGNPSFWTGTEASSPATVSATPKGAVSVPTGTSTIVFTFNQSYDTWDNPGHAESITINFWNSSCSDLFKQHDKTDPVP